MQKGFLRYSSNSSISIGSKVSRKAGAIQSKGIDMEGVSDTMGLFDDIKAQGAAYRLNEEALYAEALREMEAGLRRDGLWAKALADAEMDQTKAQALYIKLRVQALKDEAELMLAALRKAAATAEARVAAEAQAASVKKENERKRLEMLAIARRRKLNEEAIQELKSTTVHALKTGTNKVGLFLAKCTMILFAFFALIGIVNLATSAASNNHTLSLPVLGSTVIWGLAFMWARGAYKRGVERQKQASTPNEG